MKKFPCPKTVCKYIPLLSCLTLPLALAGQKSSQNSMQMNAINIENGRVTNDPLYNSIIPIKNGGGSCSATLIAPKIILTAAHCVSSYNKETKIYKQTLTKNSFIGVGTAENVYVHPGYAKATNRGKYRTNFNNDLALIEVRELNTHYKSKNYNFLPIIPQNYLKPFLPTISLVGYGTQIANIEQDLSKHIYTFDQYKAGKKLLGLNRLTNCRSCDYRKRKTIPQLEFKTKFQQWIKNHVEKTNFLGSLDSMILPGDSGAPMLETDSYSKKKYITGVASNITPLRHRRKVSFVLSYNGTDIYSQKLNYWPKGWEINSKKDDEFKEIMEAKQQIANAQYLPYDQIEVKRLFDRESIGRYVNLLYPSNFDFLQITLQKIRLNIKLREQAHSRSVPPASNPFENLPKPEPKPQYDNKPHERYKPQNQNNNKPRYNPSGDDYRPRYRPQYGNDNHKPQEDPNRKPFGYYHSDDFENNESNEHHEPDLNKKPEARARQDKEEKESEKEKPYSLAHEIDNSTCSYSEKGKKREGIKYPYSCYCQYSKNMRKLQWQCYDISKKKGKDGLYPRLKK